MRSQELGGGSLDGYQPMPYKVVDRFLFESYHKNVEYLELRRKKGGLVIHCKDLELSLRELEMLTTGLQTGFSDRKIGSSLGISVWTVHSLRRVAVLRNIRNFGRYPGMEQLAFRAEEHGLFHPDLLPYLRSRVRDIQNG